MEVQVLVAATAFVILVLGIVNVFPKRGADRITKQCSIALLLVLSAWLFTLLLSFEATTFSRIPYLLVIGVLLLVNLLGLLLALLGIIGSSEKPYVYKQGRKHAWTALVTSILYVILSVSIVYPMLLVRSSEKEVDLKKYPIAPLTRGEIIEFAPLRFEIQTPSSPWTKLDVKKINPDATVGFLRTRPQIISMIIAEDSGTWMELSTAEELAQANLRSAATNSRVIERNPYTLNGINGVRILSEAMIDKKVVLYVQGIFVHNHFVYQLVEWGELSVGKQRMFEEFDKVYSSFRIIETEQPLLAESPKDVLGKNEFKSKKYGYTIRLESGWKAVEIPRTLGRQEAEVHLEMGNDAGLFIVPVYMMGNQLTDELAAKALMKSLDFTDLDIYLKKDWLENQKEYDIDADNINVYVSIRVLTRNGFCYFLGGWANRSVFRNNNVIKHGFTQIRYDQSPKLPDPQEFSEKEKKLHALFFNAAGDLLYNKANFSESTKFFKLGFELQKNHPEFLDNVCRALVASKQHQEALNYLDKHMILFPDNRLLSGRRDEIQRVLQRTSKSY